VVIFKAAKQKQKEKNIFIFSFFNKKFRGHIFPTLIVHFDSEI